MKILFIQPRQLVTPSFFEKIATNAANQHWLALLQLAAVTPDKHKIRFIDERYKKINFDEECDLVLISCFTRYAIRAYEVADEFRRRGKTVLLAGHHAAVLPEEARQHADSVIIGEPETTWHRLLDDFGKNKLKSFYKKEFPSDKKIVPRHETAIDGAFPHSVRAETSRGCPYSCEFCQVPNENVEGKFRLRDVGDVIDEIKSLKSKLFFFADNSLTIDIEHTKSLFREMKGLNKKFTCYGHSHVLNSDEELLNLSSEAGCVAWFIGFESISQEALKQAGKKPNEVDEYKSVIGKIHDRGMAVSGHFIFGFDTDMPDVFDLTINAILFELEIDVVAFMILTPIPGSPLFDRLEKEGRILTKDWSKYTGRHVVFKPKNMSEEELRQGMWRAGKQCNSFSNSIKRILRSFKLRLTPALFTMQGNFYQRQYYKYEGLGI